MVKLKKQMQPHVKHALEQSIAHWQKMKADWTSSKPTAENCPLCNLFNKIDAPEELVCKGCPVMAKTNQTFCNRTPYFKALEAYTKLQLGLGSESRWQTAAQNEIDFLTSLLP